MKIVWMESREEEGGSWRVEEMRSDRRAELIQIPSGTLEGIERHWHLIRCLNFWFANKIVYTIFLDFTCREQMYGYQGGKRRWDEFGDWDWQDCLENPMDGGAWWAAVHGVTTEWLHFHFSLSCTGEGNGNPLQCSCLENPRDRGAWWAAVCGVAQSRTLLKRLSSSRLTYIHHWFYVQNRSLVRTYWIAQRTHALWWPKWERHPKKGDICKHIADSLFYTVKTNVML